MSRSVVTPDGTACGSPSVPKGDILLIASDKTGDPASIETHERARSAMSGPPEIAAVNRGARRRKIRTASGLHRPPVASGHRWERRGRGRGGSGQRCGEGDAEQQAPEGQGWGHGTASRRRRGPGECLDDIANQFQIANRGRAARPPSRKNRRRPQGHAPCVGLRSRDARAGPGTSRGGATSARRGRSAGRCARAR